MTNTKATTILVVDDDDGFRHSLVDACEAHGYSVFEANGALAGLTIIDEKRVDVLISDVLMPDVDGLELLDRLRKHPRRPKIIMMSGGGRTTPMNFLRMASLQGADSVLEKPFGIDVLLESVKELTTGSAT